MVRWRMTTLVYNDKRRNNYDHFLDLLDQTHINRYQDFNITFEYKNWLNKCCQNVNSWTHVRLKKSKNYLMKLR